MVENFAFYKCPLGACPRALSFCVACEWVSKFELVAKFLNSVNALLKIFFFFWEKGKTILLGSKTLATKCIRTSFCICQQTMIKTFSLGLDLLKVCFNVSLELSNCRKLLFNSTRLD